METITRRPRPHHSGNESAAIALTAQLLGSLKQPEAGEAIDLRRPICLRRPYSPPITWWSSNGNFAFSGSSSFSRSRGVGHRSWLVTVKLLDQHGRKWSRDYWAVVDDFGNLVEAAS